MKKKYVLKNKRRFGIFIGMLIILLAGLLLTTISFGYSDKSYEKIIVHTGDTLWDIAKRYSEGKDIWKTIYCIKKANNLTTSDISVGQELIIPEMR